MNHKEALIILNTIPGFSHARLKRLLEIHGTADKVLSLSRRQLADHAFLPSNVIDNILIFPQDEFLKAECELMKRHGVDVVSRDEFSYPSSLAEIPGAPWVLYVMGKLPVNLEIGLAMVGSRKASLYGCQTAEKLSMQAADLGMCIVSGMARGIDTAAHRGCLKARGETVAVLGCGLAHVYPPENKELMQHIADKGAVVSEFPMQAKPQAFNFPRRNRIISGLSLGVVVVEASRKSGALITADFALEQGKEVFAIPGPINHPNSEGVHYLIKQGAKLATSLEDILEELAPQIQSRISPQPINRIQGLTEPEDQNLTEDEEKIYKRIQDEPIHIDELYKDSHVKFSEMTDVLIKLELRKFIKQLPGKFYIR